VIVAIAQIGRAPAFATWSAAFAEHPKVRTYLACDGATAVASGLLFLSGRWAWLGFAGTLASHQGDGAQSALLRRRLADGTAAGATRFVVEAVPPAPESWQDNPSYRNILRAGFMLVYARANYLI